MRTKIIIVILFLLAGVLVFINYKNTSVKIYTKGHINNQAISLELAKTPEDQYQGLSDRQSLCPDCGMLFLFNESKSETFVMRKMNFKLDIIWLNNNKIIGYNENLTPENTEPYTLYKSPSPVNQVLEVNAGYIKNHNLKINDILTYEESK